jgi:cation diffusion facilitator CzcD-associated flavoprotein CzcO
MGSLASSDVQSTDVVIIGAGISGLITACRYAKIATNSTNIVPMPACHRLRGSRLTIVGHTYRLKAEGINFKLIDRETDVGGVWRFRANEYSHLQARSRILTPRTSTMVMFLKAGIK